MRHGPNGKPAGRRREAEGACGDDRDALLSRRLTRRAGPRFADAQPGAKRPSRQHVMGLESSTTASGYWHGGQWQAF